MRSARIAAAVMAATATTLGTIAFAGSADASAKLKLVNSSDYSMPCAWGRDGSERTMERVDVEFRHWGLTVWQATDGTQFVAIRTSQNLPFSCAPMRNPVAIPAAWTKD